MSWIGLDIGGANLKAANDCGWAVSVPFPLWRESQRLATVLAELIESAPSCDGIAVTMTGELCDCFRTKAEGVNSILDAVSQTATQQVRVYLVDARLVTIEEARESTSLAAASNWHALANFVCRFVGRTTALLVDIGSTTTDIIPIAEGHPCARGHDDPTRLLAGELVYNGVGRTPVCAMVDRLPWKGRDCPVAAELFATTADVYVTLNEISEQPNCCETADGRPLTCEFAHERLARMICADSTAFSTEDARQAAAWIRMAQRNRLQHALRQVTHDRSHMPATVVTSGAGEFLAVDACRHAFPAAEQVSLQSMVGSAASRCAPAYALAVLANEANLRTPGAKNLDTLP